MEQRRGLQLALSTHCKAKVAPLQCRLIPVVNPPTPTPPLPILAHLAWGGREERGQENSLYPSILPRARVGAVVTWES